MPTPDLNDLAPEQLKADLAWLRGLATRLVREADLAEDLVQDTLVVALERPGGGRPFLAGVLRNLSLRRARGESRRRTRERRSARDEATDSAATLAQEIASQRELMDSVLALDEPYRETLLLRFYRELKPQRIADQMGVSVNTVNSRIQRGLAQLRTRLDAEYGDRRTWCIAFLPLVDTPPPVAWPLVGAVTVKTTLAAAATLVAVSAGILIPKLTEPGQAAVATEGEVADLGDELARPDRPPVTDSLAATSATPIAGAGRVAVDGGEPPTGAGVEALEPAVTVAVAGRVVDSDGLPVTGVALATTANGTGVNLVSGDGGAFELVAGVDDVIAITVDDDDWVALRDGHWERSRSFDPLVVVERPLAIAGRVVDVFGNAVEGARVELRLPADVNSRIGLELDSTTERWFSTTTGPDGRYRIDRTPTVEGSLVAVVHDDFAAAFRSAPVRDRDDFDVVLEPRAMLGELVIRGRVVDANGQPVPDALVGMGAAVVSTDAVGVFALDPVRALDTAELTAVRAGFLPAVLERPGEPTDEATGWPSFVHVTLGTEALSIAGRLIDQRGEPIAGARVWAGDAKPFGAVGAYPLQLEAIMAGGVPPADGFAMQAGMPTTDGDERFGWYAVRSEPDGMWFYATSGEDGRFVLEGLTDRDYTLGVMLDDPLLRLETAPVAAGAEGIDVAVDVPEIHPTVRGRVVDELGEPVPGIRISLYEVGQSIRRRVLGGQTEMNLISSTAPVGSDSDGRFELRNVPSVGALIWATGDGILPSPRSLERGFDPEQLVLELPCRRRLQVELADGDRADRFDVVDGEGQVLTLYETSATSIRSSQSAPIAEGRSSVQSVGLAARTLRLWNDGELAEEIPIQLRADGVNTLNL